MMQFKATGLSRTRASERGATRRTYRVRSGLRDGLHVVPAAQSLARPELRGGAAPVADSSRQSLAELEPRPRVIVISALDDDLVELLGIFIRTEWAVCWWNNFADAVHALHADPVPAVICDRDFPGGNWRALMTITRSLPAPPPVIISSRTADDLLWLQALQEGAYDVLAKPFDEREVIRVVREASRTWFAQYEPGALRAGLGPVA